MHKTLKRNFQIMHGADWLAQLCRHIPDRFEHLVRYAGWYSNRSRGKRRRMGAEPAEVALRKADLRETSRVRSTWARLWDWVKYPARTLANRFGNHSARRR